MKSQIWRHDLQKTSSSHLRYPLDFCIHYAEYQQYLVQLKCQNHYVTKSQSESRIVDNDWSTMRE